MPRPALRAYPVYIVAEKYQTIVSLGIATFDAAASERQMSLSRRAFHGAKTPEGKRRSLDAMRAEYRA
jgi:hypothetical protein